MVLIFAMPSPAPPQVARKITNSEIQSGGW